MFNSNSHKDLLNCIDKYSLDNSENEKTVKWVREICIKNSLNFDKVANEIIRVVENAQDIKHIHNFVRAVVNRLEPQKYENANVEYEPNIQPLINDLRDKKIMILADDSVWLSVVWKYIVNYVFVDINECIALNHKIIAYMFGHNQKTFDDYKSLLKGSKTLRPFSIDWDLLETKTREEIEKWNKAIDELEAEE